MRFYAHLRTSTRIYAHLRTLLCQFAQHWRASECSQVSTSATPKTDGVWRMPCRHRLNPFRSERYRSETTLMALCGVFFCFLLHRCEAFAGLSKGRGTSEKANVLLVQALDRACVLSVESGLPNDFKNPCPVGQVKARAKRMVAEAWHDLFHATGNHVHVRRVL